MKLNLRSIRNYAFYYVHNAAIEIINYLEYYDVQTFFQNVGICLILFFSR